jgi:hypothetical protein
LAWTHFHCYCNIHSTQPLKWISDMYF